MRRNSIILAISCFFILQTVSFSYGQIAGQEIKIGLILEKSGWGAEEGITEEIGAMMAAEEINAAGGIGGVPIKLVVYDDGSNPTQSINVAKKLIFEDKVLVILGPAFSSQVEVVFPVANRAETPIVSPLSTKIGIAEKNRPWTFRNTIGSEHVFKRLIERWAKDFNIKKVAIIYDAKDRMSQDDATIVFPDALKQLGISIVTSVTYMTNDMDFSAQLTKIQSLQPDGMIISGLRNEAAQIVKQAKQKGVKIPITGGFELVAPRFIELGGKEVEGMYLIHSSWIAGNPDPKMQEFVKKAEKRSAKVQIGTLRMYDCVHISKYIIGKMGVTNKPEDLAKDRNKIRQGWATLKDYKGVEGLTSINEKGDGIKETYLLIIKDGRYQRLQ